MSLDNDIKIFDEYHTVCRDEALSLAKANKDLGTQFNLSKASQDAWNDFSNAYDELKMAENVVTGEWMCDRMPSFKEFLQKHEAIKQPRRKFFISTHSGITSMEKVEKELEKVSLPMEEVESEEEHLKEEDIPLQDAFTTPEEEVLSEIMKKKVYGNNFEEAIENYAKEADIDLTNCVVFIPSKEALHEILLQEHVLRKHIFPNKTSVVDTMKIWKQSLSHASMHYDANDLFVLNIDKERVKVGGIPYIFKEAEKYYNWKEKDVQFSIKLVGKRILK